MNDRSAGHCGRHTQYRCFPCENAHPDDYHGNGAHDEADYEARQKRVKFIEAYIKLCEEHGMWVAEVLYDHGFVHEAWGNDECPMKLHLENLRKTEEGE